MELIFIIVLLDIIWGVIFFKKNCLGNLKFFYLFLLSDVVFLEWFIVNLIKVFVYCKENECYFLLLIIILELSLFINLLFFLISNNFNFLDNILIESI